jgi:DNA replication protein DnaC
MHRTSLTKCTQELEAANYECDICKDREFIYNIQSNTAKPCECRQSKQFKRLYKASGIAKVFEGKTFENFFTKTEALKTAKNSAQKFANEYSGDSIIICGCVGVGKTHLEIAISNLLLQRNIGVLYMQYRDVLTNLKQNMQISYDGQNVYQRELHKYKTAEVLFIDDLFKGKITESDINIMYEIVNYRYLNNLAIIVTSEFDLANLVQIDEAINTRLIEMSKNNLIKIEADNFRIFS